MLSVFHKVIIFCGISSWHFLLRILFTIWKQTVFLQFENGRTKMLSIKNNARVLLYNCSVLTFMFSNSLANFNTKNYFGFILRFLFTPAVFLLIRRNLSLLFKRTPKTVGHMCLHYILNQTDILFLFFFYSLTVCVYRHKDLFIFNVLAKE